MSIQRVLYIIQAGKQHNKIVTLTRDDLPFFLKCILMGWFYIRKYNTLGETNLKLATDFWRRMLKS